jgi:hypothetical protein
MGCARTARHPAPSPAPPPSQPGLHTGPPSVCTPSAVNSSLTPKPATHFAMQHFLVLLLPFPDYHTHTHTHPDVLCCLQAPPGPIASLLRDQTVLPRASWTHTAVPTASSSDSSSRPQEPLLPVPAHPAWLVPPARGSLLHTGSMHMHTAAAQHPAAAAAAGPPPTAAVA